MSTAAVAVFLCGSFLFALGIVLPFVATRPGQSRSSASGQRTFASPPSIGVIIPAYLESSVIGDTVVELARQLRSWPGGFEITVVASDEETARVAAAHGASVLRRNPDGKAAAINFGVGESKHDVIVLSDGNCRIVPDEWPDLLLQALKTADLVSAAKTESGGGETFYWRYESAIKGAGAEPRETLAVVGEFLAFRREHFAPIPTGVLSDDLAMAIDFALRGLSVRVCTDIVTREPPIGGLDQLERRIRISAGHWGEALPQWRKLLAIPAGRQFLAHKGYRMSIGALGFWIAVLAFACIHPPWSLVATVLWLVASGLVYWRGEAAPDLLRTMSTVVVLQVVTFLGFLRAIKRRMTRRVQPGWRKVAR